VKRSGHDVPQYAGVLAGREIARALAWYESFFKTLKMELETLNDRHSTGRA
jgi:hypothetical protein